MSVDLSSKSSTYYIQAIYYLIDKKLGKQIEFCDFSSEQLPEQNAETFFDLWFWYFVLVFWDSVNEWAISNKPFAGANG